MRLDEAAARRAVSRFSASLGLRVEQAAMAIVQIANHNMIGALRSVLIERGLDPRDFTLCAFGGAGPLHASELIAEMGIPSAIIPNNPGQYSAYGFIMTNARVDRHRTTQITSKQFDARRAAEVMGTLVDECVAELNAQGRDGNLTVFRALEMRYLGQNYELSLDVRETDLSAENIDRLWRLFHAARAARFGFSTPGEIIEIVNYSVTVIAANKPPNFSRLAMAAGPPIHHSRRPIVFPSDVSRRRSFDERACWRAIATRGQPLSRRRPRSRSSTRDSSSPSTASATSLSAGFERREIFTERLLRRQVHQVRELRRADLRRRDPRNARRQANRFLLRLVCGVVPAQGNRPR
jgi:N-methylhydantoinase A/oxoprolinase/acetone carboxylase beta subunit